MKKDTHPEWYPNAEVVCDGEVVMHIGSTQPRIVVDIWSGTHPFFTGEQRLIDTEGQVDRFMRRLQVRQQMAEAAESQEVKQDPRALEVSAIGLDKRGENALLDAELTTVGDVADKLAEGDDAVLAIAGIGQTSLITIKRHLRIEGLIE